MAGKEKKSIIIRREEVVEGGHHGGAWKVAYADFVTAMMAFFLLMWLLNATTEEQRKGLADYFTPHNELSRANSGFGAPFGGRTMNSDGALASDNGAVQVTRKTPPITRPIADDDDDTNEPVAVLPTGPAESRQFTASQALQDPAVASPDGAQPFAPARARPTVPPQPTDKDIQAEVEKRERATFERAAQQIRDAVANDPALADLVRQIMIDITPEGLRIQLTDADRQPMFATGSSALNERARAVLAKIAPVLMRLPEAISVSGHTDAAPYKGGDRSNWDLSAERANATRRLLTEAGLPETRIRSVAAMADRDPLLPDDRLAAANRRIAIVVLRAQPAPTQPAPSQAAPAR